MEDMDPNLPVLLLATSDLPLKDLTEEMNDLFANNSFNVKEPDMVCFVFPLRETRRLRVIAETARY